MWWMIPKIPPSSIQIYSSLPEIKWGGSTGYPKTDGVFVEFIKEHLVKMDDDWGYQHFREPPSAMTPTAVPERSGDLNSRATVPAACGSAHKPRLGQHRSNSTTRKSWWRLVLNPFFFFGVIWVMDNIIREFTRSIIGSNMPLLVQRPRQVGSHPSQIKKPGLQWPTT